MAAHQIGIIVGSLRKEAWTRKLANILMSLAPASIAPSIIEIGQLPLYNEDEETEHPPAAWTLFREQVSSKAGIIFVAPEYNRSMPGCLKNAIDVGSRPYGKNVWQNKACAIVSSSVGAVGGFASNHHLRQSLVCVSAPCMPSETYLGNVAQLFDDKGITLNVKTEGFLKGFMQSYAEWVNKLSA
jgi:chromate reductase, NAD(P)H dehydrogenase (quinone)